MSAPPASERFPLPRWRSYRATLASGELIPRAGPAPRWYRDHVGRERAEHVYERDRDRSAAIELVSSASLVGPTALARAAAESLLAPEAPGFVNQAARRVLEWDEERVLPRSPNPVDEPDAQVGIAHLRSLLRRRPFNALRWTELSRLHTIEGNAEAARHTMRIALGLAPNDRYVLRCAARLRVHQGDAEGAHELLARTQRTRSDPWLLAAELSVAEVAGVKSRNLRVAQKLLDSGRYAPSETTELASALGSVELRAGSLRAARKLFRQALTAPTDNTVAQAQWASEHVHGLHVDPLALRAPTSWEARAYDARTAGDLGRAVDEARMWQRDQPFASRPAEFGSRCPRGAGISSESARTTSISISVRSTSPRRGSRTTATACTTLRAPTTRRPSAWRASRARVRWRRS
jgi:hypothetical protein